MFCDCQASLALTSEGFLEIFVLLRKKEPLSEKARSLLRGQNNQEKPLGSGMYLYTYL